MVQIGKTDLDIFPLQLGGNVFGWTANEAESFAVLDAFVAGGGNSIDSADVYSRGESETILGRWMASRNNRSSVIIASKVGSSRDFPGASRASILGGIAASLARLQTDYIDLYYIHRDDLNTPLEETIAALSEIVSAGRVRYVAASNYSADRLEEALRIADETGGSRFVALQPPYSLVRRDEYEGSLAAVAEKHGLSVLPYSSLASGFLTGKYRDGGDIGTSPRSARASEYLDARGRKVLAVLDEVAAAYSVPVASVALAWLRSQSTVTAPIASARTVDQVAPLLRSATLELTTNEVNALTAASARLNQ